MKISFRANFGQPPQIVFTGGGVSISAQCDAAATGGDTSNPNLRAIATGENSSLEVVQIYGPALDDTGVQGMDDGTEQHKSDFDFDQGENDSIALSPQGGTIQDESAVGTLINSGPANAVVVFDYHWSVIGGQPQGDCTYDGFVWQA